MERPLEGHQSPLEPAVLPGAMLQSPPPLLLSVSSGWEDSMLQILPQPSGLFLAVCSSTSGQSL